MPESKILLSSKDKLFFSLQQILEKNIGSASTPNERLWGIYYIFRYISVYFSHKGEKCLIHRGTFCCSESFLFLHTHTLLIADPGNHSVWSETGKAWPCVGRTAGTEHTAPRTGLTGKCLRFFLPITAGSCQSQEPSALTPQDWSFVVWFGFVCLLCFLSVCLWKKYLIVKCPSKRRCCLS